jgi:predicted GIY-YIG superfamily endonuclease
MKAFYVYLIADIKSRRTYVGVTPTLIDPSFEKEHERFERRFTSQDGFDLLVHFEGHSSLQAARRRILQIGGWSRERKLRLMRGGV